MLRSFNGLEPGGPESMIRKRLIFLGLHRKPIKPLHGACSVHEGLRRKGTQRASVLQEISLKKRGRERGRERERKIWGPEL